MSTRTEEQSYEKLVADLKEIKNKNDRFLYACHNGDDITSLKLLQHLSNKDMEVGDMLNNEECRFLFKEFCQLELSTENIDFWEECAIYEKWTNKKQRLIHGNNLYNMYISRNALKSINIDMSAVRAVKSRLDSCHIKDNDDLSDLLTHVKLLVEHCMSDTFFRFCKHELYKEKVMSLTAIDFDRIVEKKRNCATLLHICAHLNKVKCIEFLLGKGMNINCLDKQKATALDYAVANNSDNAALYLMTNGAKINFKHNSVHFPSVDMPGNYSRIAGILFDEFVHRTECSLANRYNMVGRSRNLSITNLQNINNRVNRTISLDKIGENVPMGLKSTSLFVVEDKNTLKRCNAFCYSFNSAAYAIKYRNDNWKQFNLFEHENLIAIRDLILQKDLNEQYDLYIIKERYHDNLTEFIISKKENDQFLSEKMMTNYALQLLSVFEYLQSRNYVHAPGAITPDCIYFNQMYDEIVLDIGKSSSSMWYECLFQNSQSLLTHPFVPPECKKFFILNQKKSNIQDLYKCTEKTDVYSFGVIMLMMTTLISDHTALYQLLIEGNSSRFQENLRQKNHFTSKNTWLQCKVD
jgi:ankyrin repeat protein